METVTARLFGGLGNQLFQYAVGKAVAERNNCKLILDTRETNAKGAHWRFALSHFNISAIIGDDSNLPPIRSNPIPYYLWRCFGKSPKFIRETHLGYNETINTLGGNTYLHGYFQSEKYFAESAKELHQDLQLSTPASDENKQWLDRIDTSNSISLHVRRGDYLASGDAYAVCNQDYYTRAIQHIANHLDTDPTIFVFSDDPAWAKENIETGYKTHFSDHNDGSKHYEDLRLISRCKHNITANSTFSWWGSWLNQNPDKIVVAPKNWFGKQKMHNPDITPDSWQRI
jgi:hypothetical protein